MRRRSFLRGSGAAFALGWAGCLGGEAVRPAARSSSRRRQIPVVDVHCHNFNGEDVPLATFLSGKFHEVPAWLMDANGKALAGLSAVAAPSATCERDLLAGGRSCRGQALAHEGLEISKWMLANVVDRLLGKLGLDPPGPAELDLGRRFLADIDSVALERIEPDIRRSRELFAARGNQFTPADRLVQLLGLVGLGLVYEGGQTAVKIGKLVLAGSKALDRDELERLEARAQARYLEEFARLYGAALDRQIEEDASPAGRKGPAAIGRELERWGKALTGALRLESLARSGARLLALLWSQVRGYALFVTNFFRFRHELSAEVAATYSRVDLFVPALVDFSYWTGTAEQPRSRLAEQIAVQRQLATAALESAEAERRGRSGRFRIRSAFLPLIAFNPLREVLTPSAPEHDPDRALETLEGALDLVRAAVLEHGFIGVKLYPPVGFAPLGNDRHRRWQDGRLAELDRSLAGERLERWREVKDDLGRHLDEALRALYRFCEEKEVPILAHSNDSNNFQPGYGWCSGPAYWSPVVDEFRGLRICLGHFGHFTGVNPAGDPDAPRSMSGCFGDNPSYAWSYRTADLFGRGQVYVDLSNSDAGADDKARERLVGLLRKLDQHSHGVLRERLMYGSDWFMNVLVGPHESFLANLQAAFETVWPGRQTLAEVMGGNALRFLGLTSGPDGAIPANLERVRRIYGERLPDWLRES